MNKSKETTTEQWIIRVSNQNAYIKGDWFATSQVRHRLEGACPDTVNRVLEQMVDRGMLEKRMSSKGNVNTVWYKKTSGYDFIGTTTREHSNKQLGIKASTMIGAPMSETRREV